MMRAAVMAEVRARSERSNPRQDLLVDLECRQGEVVMEC